MEALTHCSWVGYECPHIRTTEIMVTCDRCKKQRDKARKLKTLADEG